MTNPFRNLQLAWKNPRLRRALVIAVVSDILGFAVVLLPTVQWALDAVTAVLLLLVLGFRWQLFIALAIEVIPFLELFPAWTLVVMALAATTNENGSN
jgi:hypothetical protein